MRARGIPAFVVLASACGASVPAQTDGAVGGDDTDAPPGTIDAPATPDAMLGPWATPVMIPTAGTPGPGNDDIWMATRDAIGAPWNSPTVVPSVNSGSDDRTLTPCAGNRYVMISFRGGTGDFYEGRFGQAPALVAELSDPAAAETGAFV